jgi:hypothetical protein
MMGFATLAWASSATKAKPSDTERTGKGIRQGPRTGNFFFTGMLWHKEGSIMETAIEIYKNNKLTIKETLSFFTIRLYGPGLVFLLWPVALFFRGEETVSEFLREIRELIFEHDWLEEWAEPIKLRIALQEIKRMRVELARTDRNVNDLLSSI